MNGLDLAARVLEVDVRLPILFISGTASNADPGYGCVEEPFRRSELLARVKAVLQRPAV